MESQNPTLVCEVCGARVANLRRGRCWICYVRWAESRPVGGGAVCVVCGDRRRENLRMVELHSSWLAMCHNCGAKAMRLSPMPRTLEAIRHRLGRDRRWQERRHAKEDSRIFKKERRVGERRLSPELSSSEWLDAADLIVEIIEVNDVDEQPADATRIARDQQSLAPQPPPPQPPPPPALSPES